MEQKDKKYYNTWLKMSILGFSSSSKHEEEYDEEENEEQNPRMGIFSHVL